LKSLMSVFRHVGMAFLARGERNSRVDRCPGSVLVVLAIYSVGGWESRPPDRTTEALSRESGVKWTSCAKVFILCVV
jgi:hypothetical protein